MVPRAPIRVLVLSRNLDTTHLSRYVPCVVECVVSERLDRRHRGRIGRLRWDRFYVFLFDIGLELVDSG